jgi:uncharacterized membrane protein
MKDVSDYMTVHVKRHLAKAVTYRIVGTLTTFIISYIFTGSILVSSAIGVVELLIKPLNYFIHERVWYTYIKYGLTKQKEE